MITGLDLLEARDFIKLTPFRIKEGVSREAAIAIQHFFEAAGLTVTLKSLKP
jgi:ribosomal protein L7/L12